MKVLQNIFNDMKNQFVLLKTANSDYNYFLNEQSFIYNVDSLFNKTISYLENSFIDINVLIILKKICDLFTLHSFADKYIKRILNLDTIYKNIDLGDVLKLEPSVFINEYIKRLKKFNQ